MPHEQSPLRTLDTQQDRRQAIAYHVEQILKLVGEDVTRSGLLDTPMRVAKMYEEVLAGTFVDPSSTLNTTFEEPSDGPVVVSDITFYSLCEHHMVPFHGVAHVGYLPGEKIVGLSKLARLVDVLAGRLQVQERMTQQIVRTIQDVLAPHGAIALVEAEHTCMCSRGVKKPGTKTMTLAASGVYETNVQLRDEFFKLIRR